MSAEFDSDSCELEGYLLTKATGRFDRVHILFINHFTIKEGVGVGVVGEKDFFFFPDLMTCGLQIL